MITCRYAGQVLLARRSVQHVTRTSSGFTPLVTMSTSHGRLTRHVCRSSYLHTPKASADGQSQCQNSCMVLNEAVGRRRSGRHVVYTMARCEGSVTRPTHARRCINDVGARPYYLATHITSALMRRSAVGCQHGDTPSGYADNRLRW